MNNTERLRQLVPLNSLAKIKFQELLSSIAIQQLPKKSTLFNEGDTDNDMVYLLSGDVTLSSKKNKTKKTVSADSEQARFALAQLKPRQMAGIATTDVTVARINSDTLDNLLTMDQLDSTWEQIEGYEVLELDADTINNDWMLTLLQNKAFQQLPTENIHALFTRMEPVTAKSGEVIIKQGDPGDYFYIVKQGRCTVSRKDDKGGKVSILTELYDGDSFGEEALLSGAPRNATIVMIGDGVLMRLAKLDFDELLKEPIVKMVSVEEAQEIVKSGGGLIDVRLEVEHKNGALKGSINIPLYMLRLKMQTLRADQPYVLFCQNGSRSKAAAFLLGQHGFDISVLQNGLTGLKKPVAEA